MAYRVVFWQNIMGKSEVNVTTLSIQEGMIIKGNFRTPISNIKCIQVV